MTALLSVRELTVRFRTEDGPVLAVDQASFDVAPREVLALVGESGCGKSVTATALTGLLPPNATVTGEVTLDGTSLLGLGEASLRDIRGRDIAYIFQEPMTSLNPVLTVGRQIGEVLRRHQHMRGEAARRRAVELLNLVGIPLASRSCRPHRTRARSPTAAGTPTTSAAGTGQRWSPAPPATWSGAGTRCPSRRLRR